MEPSGGGTVDWSAAAWGAAGGSWYEPGTADAPAPLPADDAPKAAPCPPCPAAAAAPPPPASAAARAAAALMAAGPRALCFGGGAYLAAVSLLCLANPFSFFLAPLGYALNLYPLAAGGVALLYDCPVQAVRDLPPLRLLRLAVGGFAAFFAGPRGRGAFYAAAGVLFAACAPCFGAMVALGGAYLACAGALLFVSGPAAEGGGETGGAAEGGAAAYTLRGLAAVAHAAAKVYMPPPAEGGRGGEAAGGAG